MIFTNKDLTLFKTQNLNVRHHINKNNYDTAFRDLYELIHTDEHINLKNDIKYNSEKLYAELSIDINHINEKFPKIKEFLKERFELDLDELLEFEEFKDINMITFDFPEFAELHNHIINEENLSKIKLLEQFESNSSNLFEELIKLGKISVDELHVIHKRLISEGKNFEI